MQNFHSDLLHGRSFLPFLLFVVVHRTHGGCPLSIFSFQTVLRVYFAWPSFSTMLNSDFWDEWKEKPNKCSSFLPFSWCQIHSYFLWYIQLNLQNRKKSMLRITHTQFDTYFIHVSRFWYCTKGYEMKTKKDFYRSKIWSKEWPFDKLLHKTLSAPSLAAIETNWSVAPIRYFL